MSDSWKDIKQRLDPLNISRGVFYSDNSYGIPLLKDDKVYPSSISKLIPFGVSRERDGTCHFFLDDYRFQRVFTHSKRYLNMFEQFEYVMTPDFSLYSNYPIAAQIWNTYRNRWCGCFWQQYGIKVIPTISWSSAKSYPFCFSGVPQGSTVAVSSVGAYADKNLNKKQRKEILTNFKEGYQMMMEKINPKHVIFYGKPVEGLTGNITHFKQFASKFKEE